MLEGMRVVSFCHYLQGPAATQYLADQGADVIKVEPPRGAYERHWSGAGTFVDGTSAFYLSANRNKRSFAVDLKHPEGRAAVYRLIENSDVVVENFRPGVMERLGFGYEELQRIKPNLIYASATGFGTSGPMRDRPGQDLLVQARSGLVAATGDRDNRPTPVGCAVVDQHGASLLALGILSAYVRRLKEGRGSRVEASLLNAGLDLQTEPLTLYFSGHHGRERFARDPHLATWYHEAPYGIYRTLDCFVALSMNDLGKLAKALDSDALKARASGDADQERNELAPLIADILTGLEYEDIARRFDAHGVWYERVQDYDDLLTDPQIQENEVFREVKIDGTEAVLVNHPLRYDGTTPRLRRLALQPGEHTRELLGEAGYTEAEINDLLQRHVAFCPQEAAAV